MHDDDFRYKRDWDPTGQWRHGDVFPLPLPGQERWSSPSPAVLQLSAPSLRQLRQIISRLNELASFRINPNARPPSKLPRRVRATRHQAEVIDDLARRLSLYGPDCFEGEDGLLRQLLGAHSLYGEEPKNLASFELKRLKVCDGGVEPKRAARLLPPEASAILRHFESFIERSPDEVERILQSGAVPKCYWDPALGRSRVRKRQLLKRLCRLRVCGAHFQRKCSVGLFFVKKKDGYHIRMVVDARLPNLLHQSPPSVSLGSPSALSELCLDAHALEVGGWGGLTAECFKPQFESTQSEADVRDAFYQFHLPELGSWFCLDQCRAGDVDVKEAWCDDRRDWFPVTPDTLVWVALDAMCMGWTWAMFFCQSAVSMWACESVPRGVKGLLVHRMPSPVISPGDPVVSVYVDNLLVFAGCFKDAVLIAEKFAQILQGRNVAHTRDNTGVVEIEALGLRFEPRKPRYILRHKDERLWRFYHASQELLALSRWKGQALSVWVGHATHISALAPCLLSILDEAYKFVETHRAGSARPSSTLRWEIAVFADLCFLASCDLGSSFDPEVYVGDSSNYGYALMSTWATDEEMADAARHKEKWKLRKVAPPTNPCFFAGGLCTEEFGAAGVLPDHGASPSGSSRLLPKAEIRGQLAASLPTANVKFAKWLDDQVAVGNVSPDSAPGAFRKEEEHLLLDFLVPPLALCWDDRARWTTIVEGMWQHQQEHINVKECRVVFMAIRRACMRRRTLGRKILVFTDNLVSALVLEKGRSRAKGLNSLARRVCAYCLAHGLRVRYRYLETGRNPADEGSRRLEHPKAAPRVLPLSRVVPPPGLCAPVAGLDRSPGETFACRSDRVRICLDELVPDRADISCRGCVHAVPQSSGPRPPVPASTPLPAGRGKRVVAAKIPERIRVAKDLENLNDDSFDRRSARTVPRLRDGAGFLEIFAGCGQLSACLQKFGNVLPPIDIRDGPCFDMRFKKLQDIILDYISSGKISYVHLGTPCTAWSISRTRIVNKSKARKLEMEAVEFALFTAKVVRCCHRHGVLWSVENPQSSKLWAFHPISELYSLPGAAEIIFDMCCYGSPYKKPTKILSNVAGLCQLSQRCQGGHTHTIAQGSQVATIKGVSKHVANTTLAGAYPAKLARRWASIVSRALPPQSRCRSLCHGRQLAFDLEVGCSGLSDGAAACAAARGSDLRPPLSCFDAAGFYTRPWEEPKKSSPHCACSAAHTYLIGNEARFWHSKIGGRRWSKHQ